MSVGTQEHDVEMETITQTLLDLFVKYDNDGVDGLSK